MEAKQIGLQSTLIKFIKYDQLPSLSEILV